MKPGGDGFARQSTVEGTVIGSQDFGTTQGVIETPAGHGTAAPLFERGVGPGDAQVRTDNRHTIRERFENTLSLQKIFRLGPDIRIAGVRIDAVEALDAKKG